MELDDGFGGIPNTYHEFFKSQIGRGVDIFRISVTFINFKPELNDWDMDMVMLLDVEGSDFHHFSPTYSNGLYLYFKIGAQKP